MVALGPAAPALGEGGYEAQFAGQSGYPTLESGERTHSEFQAKNVGTKTWTPTWTNLGASGPRDRQSPLRDDGWRTAIRPTAVNTTVAPGETGRFAFTVLAPAVSQQQVFREHFEPVNDDPQDAGWMNWGSVYLDYTVLPAEKPSVAFNSAPLAVDPGQPIDLVATARDNRAVTGVVFGIRGRPDSAGGKPGEASSYSGRLETAGLAPGDYTVVARATDPVGQTAEATSVVTVRAVAATPTPVPAAPSFEVGVRFTWALRGRTTRARILTLGKLKAGDTVGLRCSGRGCPFRRRSVATKGRSRVALAKALRNRRLRAGAVLTVTVRRPAVGTRTVTFRMRSRRAPRASARCRDATGTRVRCGS